MTAIRLRIATPLSAFRGSPATRAVPELGTIRVPRVRTVVVLPAPLGPRKPNTSPYSTLKDTSWNAVRSPKRLVRFSTTSAGPAGGVSARMYKVISLYRGRVKDLPGLQAPDTPCPPGPATVMASRAAPTSADAHRLAPRAPPGRPGHVHGVCQFAVSAYAPRAQWDTGPAQAKWPPTRTVHS